MIIDCIFPEDHLPIVQQLLLIHHTISETVLHTLFNILDLTLDELKCILSKLQSHFLDLHVSPSIMHPSWNSCLIRQDQGNTALRISVTTLVMGYLNTNNFIFLFFYFSFGQ